LRYSRLTVVALLVDGFAAEHFYVVGNDFCDVALDVFLVGVFLCGQAAFDIDRASELC
jgi:hypothetical protein